MTINEFIKEAREIHGDKFDYSHVSFVKQSEKVKIICPNHGPFYQTVRGHIKFKSGCKKCADEKRCLTTDSFIEKSNKIHNGIYDYSKTEYKKSTEEVIIICKKHGEFKQIAQNHLNGNGCPKCTNNTKHTTDKFIEKAKKVHGTKYLYDKIDYRGNKEKVLIGCKQHGYFEQSPVSHLNGHGCNKCHLDKIKLNNVEDRATKIHGNKYDYSNVEYVNTDSKIKIKCEKHGEFEQTPFKHLQGQGCPKCAKENLNKDKIIPFEEFVKRSNKAFRGLFKYDEGDYTKASDYVTITCPKHGKFKQIATAHMLGFNGCKGCVSTSISNQEKEVVDFIKSFGVEIKTNNRELLNGQELDILIPSKKLAIEYNGLYWHSDIFKNSNYHLNKTERLDREGYQLVQIFEDEWTDKTDIVKSRLSNILGKTKNRIYARKTVVREVDTKKAMQFLDNNHIQGRVGGRVKLGLFVEDELVSLMTFGSLRKNLGNISKEGSFELLRFCNKLNTTVVGGASKLFKYFVNHYQPSHVISYADRRWSSGRLYEKLDFSLSYKTKPNYFYIKDGNRENRFKYRKSELLKWGWGKKEQTEKEIMNSKGYMRIYDSGTLKYEWHNN